MLLIIILSFIVLLLYLVNKEEFVSLKEKKIN